MQQFKMTFGGLSHSPKADKFATIDFALALPTLSVVFGSRLGGGGGCTIDRP